MSTADSLGKADAKSAKAPSLNKQLSRLMSPDGMTEGERASAGCHTFASHAANLSQTIVTFTTSPSEIRSVRTTGWRFSCALRLCAR